jgi:hypothetical protein
MLLTSSVGLKKDTLQLSCMNYVNIAKSGCSSLAGTISSFPVFDLKGFQAFLKNMKWIMKTHNPARHQITNLKSLQLRHSLSYYV